MALESREETHLDDLHIMTHPIRRKIVQALDDQGPMYIARIAKTLNMKHREKLIAFHLSVLSAQHLVEGHYDKLQGPPIDESGRPIIVNYYELTKRAKEIISTHNL